ncbi:NUDIX domain-containing protein [Ornithinibacillus sp. FSL M8-0202]|uniref:NUDIX hydrolase n=1 Tax=Ornithinibacillus sp. FSL M8-0202 TaxID=2921616 RepID=UPI0030D29BD0
MTAYYVTWGEATVKLTWKKDFNPPIELVTSIHGFCFKDGKIMLVELDQRGWDIPGGHLEQGETPEQCFQREVLEEGCVEGDLLFLGAVEIDHHENPTWSETSKYPVVGYQLFYRMDITKTHPFEANDESGRRVFVSTTEIANYYNMPDIHQEIVAYALEVKEK